MCDPIWQTVVSEQAIKLFTIQQTMSEPCIGRTVIVNDDLTWHVSVCGRQLAVTFCTDTQWTTCTSTNNFLWTSHYTTSTHTFSLSVLVILILTLLSSLLRRVVNLQPMRKSRDTVIQAQNLPWVDNCSTKPSELMTVTCYATPARVIGQQGVLHVLGTGVSCGWNEAGRNFMTKKLV